MDILKKGFKPSTEKFINECSGRFRADDDRDFKALIGAKIFITDNRNLSGIQKYKIYTVIDCDDRNRFILSDGTFRRMSIPSDSFIIISYKKLDVEYQNLGFIEPSADLVQSYLTVKNKRFATNVKVDQKYHIAGYDDKKGFLINSGYWHCFSNEKNKYFEVHKVIIKNVINNIVIDDIDYLKRFVFTAKKGDKLLINKYYHRYDYLDGLYGSSWKEKTKEMVVVATSSSGDVFAVHFLDQQGRKIGSSEFNAKENIFIFADPTRTNIMDEITEVQSSRTIDDINKLKVGFSNEVAVGTKVIKGFDWDWNSQDEGSTYGVITEILSDKWASVTWIALDDTGRENKVNDFYRYRIGASGKYDLFNYDMIKNDL